MHDNIDKLNKTQYTRCLMVAFYLLQTPSSQTWKGAELASPIKWN